MSAKAAVDTGDVELVEKDAGGGADEGQWSTREMSKRQARIEQHQKYVDGGGV